MEHWLLIAASAIAAAAPANTALNTSAGPDARSVRSSSLNLRVVAQPVPAPSWGSPGMIINRNILPNGRIGLGLGNVVDIKSGTDNRSARGRVRSRRPSVSFVLKF